MKTEFLWDYSWLCSTVTGTPRQECLLRQHVSHDSLSCLKETIPERKDHRDTHSPQSCIKFLIPKPHTYKGSPFADPSILIMGERLPFAVQANKSSHVLRSDSVPFLPSVSLLCTPNLIWYTPKVELQDHKLTPAFWVLNHFPQMLKHVYPTSNAQGFLCLHS